MYFWVLVFYYVLEKMIDLFDIGGEKDPNEDPVKVKVDSIDDDLLGLDLFD